MAPVRRTTLLLASLLATIVISLGFVVPAASAAGRTATQSHFVSNAPSGDEGAGPGGVVLRREVRVRGPHDSTIALVVILDRSASGCRELASAPPVFATLLTDRSWRDLRAAQAPSGPALKAEIASGRVIDRYYDPSTGQFVSIDPMVAQTSEPYGYANDDPVDGVDPTGELLCGAGYHCGSSGGPTGGGSTQQQPPTSQPPNLPSNDEPGAWNGVEQSIIHNPECSWDTSPYGSGDSYLQDLFTLLSYSYGGVNPPIPTCHGEWCRMVEQLNSPTLPRFLCGAFSIYGGGNGAIGGALVPSGATLAGTGLEAIGSTTAEGANPLPLEKLFVQLGGAVLVVGGSGLALAGALSYLVQC